MSKIKMGIISQTPYIRFNRKLETAENTAINLSELNKEDYIHTVGGVSIMVNNMISRMSADFVSKAFWFALNPNAPAHIVVDDKLELFNISPTSKVLKAYTNFKEVLWNNIHGFSTELYTLEEYLGYLNYNWLVTKNVLDLDDDLDVCMVHDFQQLMTGLMIGPTKPAVLRWHIPFIPEYFTTQIKKFIVGGLEGFDSIIVSTKRDLEGLIRAGYRGFAYQLYPHLEPTSYKKVSKKGLDMFNTKYELKEDDFLVLNVARMDMMKSQDVAIQAIAKLKRKIPNIKLMCVGNGSFTSSSIGLGHSKGTVWKHKLLELAKKLDVEDRVIFTGYLSESELFKAYERADVFVLPSKIEGFGLTVVEAWLYDKPTIVSHRAGVAELITDEVNGFTFRSGKYEDLANKIQILYSDDRLREDLGKNAHKIAKQCYTSNAIPNIERVLTRTIENFKR